MSQPLEKVDIEVRFIPILCATPLLYAQRYGLFEANGLRVTLRTALGWSGVKELVAHGKADVAHMLSPMPFASRLGIDGKPAEIRLGAVQNVNGQAITLAKKHERVKDVRDMRGFVLGVPYRFSMQYYLLCDLFAKSGLNPLSDISIVEVVPPRMPYSLEKGRIDGVLAPEPFNQIIVDRGIGFIFALSRDIWPGHPCCAIAADSRFIEACPNAHKALLRSIVQATRALHAAEPDERARIARAVAELGFWSEKDIGAIEQALTGSFQDGRGARRDVRDRIDFLPFARTEHAVWILSQMQRWGQLPREVDYRATAEATLMPALLDELTKEAGFSASGRLPAGLEPSAPEGALEEMKRQPFSAFRPREAPPAGYAMGPATRARLGAILEKLARVAGDGAEIELETTSEDEIGWLEHMLNETLKNLRFAREAQQEKLDLEEQALRQRAIIEAQERLIHELSTPILPVLEGVLVLPILGDVDEARGRKITEALLAAVCTARASLVLIDITGVLSVRREVVGSLVGMARAVALLGAECVLVGVSPSVAAAITASGEELAPAVTRRDLRSGLELAMQRRRERRVRAS